MLSSQKSIYFLLNPVCVKLVTAYLSGCVFIQVNIDYHMTSRLGVI